MTDSSTLTPPRPVPESPAGESATDRYRSTRALTEALAAPLSAEDQVVQSMPDASPTKWHRAHTTWFFETFLLLPHLAGYEPVDPAYGYLFNSYYEAVGPRHARPRRGMITRPSVAAVADYRSRVDDAMETLLADVVPDRPDLAALVELGCHHEQQHQELLLMDVKHLLSCNPTAPAYLEALHAPSPSPSLVEGRSTGPEGAASAPGWIRHDGGIVAIGHDPDDGFAFDNEGPRHDALVRPFRLADRPVTSGEWLEFMADGGYTTPTLWLSDGWATVTAEGWHAPDYWSRDGDGAWNEYTLRGLRPVDPTAPVVHVSYYEADAFARWAGGRLPTEFEWELAARDVPVAGNLLHDPSRSPLHPAATAGGEVPGPSAVFGDVWEWTASPYSPYPGFAPAPGAVGEYNGKFMVDQHVLRGGCAVTPVGHVRATYRNFFPARARWAFAGLRLAEDAS